MKVIHVWIRKTYYDSPKKLKKTGRTYLYCSKENAKQIMKNQIGTQMSYKIDYPPFYYGIYRWVIDGDNFWKVFSIIVTIVLAIVGWHLKMW